MRVLMAVLVFLLAGPAGAARKQSQSQERQFSNLRPGIYDIRLEGLVCTACADAVQQAVAGVKGVKDASVDFEKGNLRVNVAEGRGVRLSALEKAVSQASQRMKIGSTFRLGTVRYVP